MSSGRVCARAACGESLDGMRPEARYCSGACRAAASRERGEETAAPASPEVSLVSAPTEVELLTPPEPWRNTRQVAEHFGVSLRTVDRWISAGLPCWRPRRLGRTLLRLSVCEAWLDDETTAS